MIRRRLAFALGVVLSLLTSIAAHAGEVARGELAIVGLGIEIDRAPVSAATGIPSSLQTIFGGRTNDDAPAAPGLAVLGDLTGPGIDAPITLSAIPGRKFSIPALNTTGQYTLQNIRLVGANGEYLQSSVPSFATINVTDALKTSVRVRQLTPEEMRERGILLDSRNYDVYEYTFIFAVDQTEVEVPYPVVVDKVRGTTVQFGQGAQSPPALPRNGPRQRFVPAPRKVFDIGQIGELPPEAEEAREKEGRVSPPRLPAALVMPTGFGVLHQFFAVILEVTNATEDGSQVRLDSITASLRAPLQMRVAKVNPAVAVGQPVPIRDETTGATFLVAGARGTAEWSLEALKTGTHTVDIDVYATYQKPGEDDFPMAGKVSASIVVSDPRFQINFSHPDTVRKDERYTAYAFVTNLSERRQHVILDTSEIPACTSGGALENICRTEGDGKFELDLEPGEMTPVPYKLLSKVTGKVFAAAGSASDETLGVSVRLTMGVSLSGIPLSPATLLMPYYTQFLPSEFVEANLQLLGLGYSLAVAPLNKMTAAHPRVITTDVFTRAQEIARAGQRIFVARQQRNVDVAEEDRDAMIHLSLDLLDNVERVELLPRLPLLEEWDQLRRNEEAGRRSAAAMARELERTARATPAQFVDDFAAAASHRAPFFFAYAHGAGVNGLSVTGLTSGNVTDVPAEATNGWKRSLVTGEVTNLTIGGEAGQLAMVGRWSESYRVTVKPLAQTFTLHLLYPDTTDGKLLRADVHVTGATVGVPVIIDVQRGARTLHVQYAGATTSVIDVPQAPLRLLGAAQDLHLDGSGHVVTLLFNRPVTLSDGEKWRDHLALTINVPKASYTVTRRNDRNAPNAEKQIPSALPQDDGRMINITFDKTLSKNATYEIAVDSVRDRLTSAPFDGTVVPRVDNDRPAAILTGKVLLPDNTPAAGALVTLNMGEVYDLTSVNPFESLIQADITTADGRYMFEYVARDPSRNIFGQYELGATANGKNTGVHGAVRLPGEVHTVNLVFHGRGTARGQVRYDDGTPIPRRRVTATSPVFGEEFAAITDANGRYEMEVGVGPLTFYVYDPNGRVAFAANHLRIAGEVISQDLVVVRDVAPGVGTVRVTVRRPDTNEPLAEANVGASVNGYRVHGGLTDANGVFTFRNIPAGLVSIAVTHSHAYSGLEVELRADQTVEQTILLDIAEHVEFATVEGRVMRDDPAAPNDTSRDVPVPNAVLMIRDYGKVITAADGTFRIDDIPLALTGAGITIYDPATKRQETSAIPSLIANQVANLPIRFSSTRVMTGHMRVRLFDAKGNPVSAARVFSPGYPPVKLSNAGSGVFEVRNVPVPRSESFIAVAETATYGDQSATGSVRVDYDGQTGYGDIRLPGAGTITVEIVVEQTCSNPPCEPAQALGRASATYMVWNDFEQGFRPKTIEAEADPATGIVTFQKIPARQDVLIATVKHPLGFAADKVHLTHDGDARRVTLRLKDMGDVSGRVFAIDGLTPVSGATARIIVNTAQYSPKLTPSDGSFNFPGIAANLDFQVVAELHENGIYRTGIVSGKTPEGGGPVGNLRVVMREQSSVEGVIVDANDDPVPLAHYWLRELAWPHRTIGSAQEPLQADLAGRFLISNVFTGPFRISAVSAQNQELRGDYQGTLAEEGDVSQRNIRLRIGEGGVGSVSVTVRDPLLGFEAVPNAEVALYRDGRSFDFTSTNENGVAFFEQVPAGSYSASAFSKARVRGGRSDAFNVVADGMATAAIELDFRGVVSGYLTDPASEPVANARVPYQPVTVHGGSPVQYTMRQSTDENGNFEIAGMMEGPFNIFGYEIGTERMAFGPKGLFISRLVPEHRDLHLELEKWARLTVKVHLPDDNGGPGELAPLVHVDVTHADGSYGRAYQGNPVVFERMSQWRLYNVTATELGGEGRQVTVEHSKFPAGVFEHEQVIVLPATGTVEVLVLDANGNPVRDAAVNVRSSRSGGGRNYSAYTPANGLIVLPGVPFGDIHASTVVGSISAAASAELRSRSQPLRLTLKLGANISITGTVRAETPKGSPSANTRVMVEVSARNLTSRLRLETFTDENGVYTFHGIPVGGTALDLTYYTPADRLGWSARELVPDGTTGTFTLPAVDLDATRPQVTTIDPAVNSTNVSPAPVLTVTFSEQIRSEYLTKQYFQLRAVDSPTVINLSFQTSVRPDDTYVVRLTPIDPPAGQTHPLRPNVMYRLTVTNDIRDMSGQQLVAVAGTSFTTVNYVEPDIVRVEPNEAEALVEGQTFRIKFNKAIDLRSFDTGNGGIVVLDRLKSYKGDLDSAVPVEKYLDPQDPSTLIVAPKGVAIAESAFYRLTVAGVRDLNEPPNAMRATRIYEYFSFDRVTPVARIVSPVAAGEKLIAGVLYEATVFVSDDGTNESKDIAYVDWLNDSGIAISRANAKPFAYSFVAPQTTTGTTFTLKASATDLSFNTSEVASFTWDVAPNEAPREIVVTNTPSSVYPGKSVDTRVAFKDEGLAVTVALELRGTKLDGTPLTQILGSKKVTRTATTAPFDDALFTWTLPVALKDGSATVVASITDASNKIGTADGALTVLADTTAPSIVSLLPNGESRFKFGENGTYDIELQATDGETGIARAVFTINGNQVFDGSGTFNAATGITTFKHTVNVPPRNADTRVTIGVTVYDHRNNPFATTREVIYERVENAAVPVAEWLTPLDGAALPSNENGWLTTLRIRATDDVKVVSVRFESEALAAPVTLTAPKSGTTDMYEAKVALTMPATPFVIRAIVADSEDDRTHDVELPITIDPIAAETTISGDVAITSLNASQYANKNVLIRGGARVYVAAPLTMKNLMVVDGSTISNPEETKLDLTIDERFFVDADSSVDLTEKGYVGGLRSSEGNRVVNSSRTGRTIGGTTNGGATFAAGSHAGIGGSSRGTTNATYGAITEPADFGSGGSALATGTLGGGNGGGAMSLRGGSGLARFVIAGALRADGGSAPTNASAGAGGSIDLRARALITGAATRITANGGDETASDEVDRGGGGGRIALRASERFEVSEANVEARGGRNGALAGAQYVDGGAGTIYTLRPGSTLGTLRVTTSDSTHSTMGTPLSGEFDAILIGPRVLARFDAEPTSPLNADASALIAGPTDLPTIELLSTTPVAGTNVPQATSIAVRTNAASVAGIREIRTILQQQPADVTAYPRFVTSVADHASSILIPATATPGSATLKVRVTDRAGRTAELTPVLFNIVTNNAPVIDTMNVTPATETYAGRNVTISATASDDVEVTTVTLTSSTGSITAQTATKPTATTMAREFTVAIPPATPKATEVTLTLAASDGFPNRAATVRTHKLLVLEDKLQPSVTILQPAPEQELLEGGGAKFVLEVDATDAEVGVQRVVATFDGAEYELERTATTWRKTIDVPNVEGNTPVAKTLVVTAYDYAANVDTEQITLYVKPLFDPLAPALSWVCASPGAMAPAGYETAFRISAVPSSATNGVASVELTVNGTPLTVTSVGTNLYEAKFTIPAGTADNTLFNIRVAARSVGDNEATLLGTLTSVTGTEVSTASIITADDTAFEDRNVIVRSGGVLTVHGAHHLRNLVVLSGGKVVQQHADKMRAELLTVDRLFVGCGASIDVSGLGFARNVAAPGAAMPDYHSGGGHIGRGGVAHRAAGSSYGSITGPREAGSGGSGPAAASTSGAGGGAVRIHATATMTVDGAIKANGAGSNMLGWGGGAGGSVWLSATGALTGAGSVEASGDRNDHIRATGGGGAIAIEYGTASGTLLSNLSSYGAYTGWGAEGGAGSIFTRAAGATYGDLLLDNRGNNSKYTYTELPSLGRVAAASVNGTTVTLSGTRWLAPSFEGHRVRVFDANGDVRGTYRIVSVTNDANVVTINGFAEVQTQDAIAYDGYLVYSPQGINGRNILAARWANDRWEYDSGSIFTAFNPRAGEVLFATFSKNTSAITALSTFNCDGGCPAVIHGMPVVELSAGEIAANSIPGLAGSDAKNVGALDDAEFFVRPDARGRSLLLTRGVDATITLADEHGGSVNVSTGDTLHGIYLFDKVTLATTKVLTGDLFESASAPVLDATSSLDSGNKAAPLIDASNVTIERGLYGPVLVAPAGAVSDSESPLDVIARTSNAALSAPAWNRNWQIFAGDRGGLSLGRRPGNETGPWGISSLDAIASSGSVAFSASQTNQQVQAGLAPADTTLALTEPGIFAFRLRTDGRYEIWASGTNTGKNAVYTTATVFRIEKTPSRIRFIVDGVRMHEVNSGIPASLRFDLSTSSETAELHSIEYDTISDGSRFRAAAAANGSFRLPLRGAAGAPITIAARDRHRLPLTSREVVAATMPNNIGVASIAFNPAEVTGGRSSTVTVTLLAPAGSEGALVELTSDHAAATVPPTLTIPANAVSATFTLATTAVSAQTDANISATYGGNGVSTPIRILKDTLAPVVTITSPAANAQYTEGQTAKIVVQATITDADSGVKRAFATLDGVEYPMTAAGNVYSAQLPVPFISESSDVTKSITVTSEDNSANHGDSSVSIVIRPVVDTNPPTIAIACGTDGAEFPPAYIAKLRFVARGPSAGNPIEKVEVTITDPNGVATTSNATAVTGLTDTYEVLFTVPDLADASLFTVRATAFATSGSNAISNASFRVVKGVEIKTNVTIGAADTTYDNKVVVIYPNATVTLDGAHTFQRLIVLGTLQPVATKTLDITATSVFVACDARLDANEKGYPHRTTHPDARNVQRIQEGASHIGRGSIENNGAALTGASYGSVYEPRELGASGWRSGTGGGAIRIQAANVLVDGIVRANGGNGGGEASGAGGSIFISATKLAGGGSVDADGGNGCWAGGGGAVSIHYNEAPGAFPLANARPGNKTCGNSAAGPGTVLLRGPASLGNLTIDTATRGAGILELPSLGSGTAQGGSSGATLVTDRATDVPAYFVAHWVRITSATGVVKGTWRIASVSGRSVTLEGDAINIVSGDSWQGLYRFDDVTATDVELISNDPIEAADETLNGAITTKLVRAETLTIKSGATLKHVQGSSLELDVTGKLTIESGALIDVSARGYNVQTTYPGARNVQKIQEGASHIGRGSTENSGAPLTGATYGSIYAPRELGASGWRGGIGGGIVRINAGEAQLDGIIRANGGPGGGEASGAGGSIHITALKLAGNGTVEADGGNGCWAGGGGAVSATYDEAGTTLPLFNARAGSVTCGNTAAGAGSVFVSGPQAVRGNATFDNTSRGNGITELPAIGRAVAQSGTAARTIVTTRDYAPFFIGHSVEVEGKGTYRITAISGKNVTLDGGTFAPGDVFRGLYSFDTLELRNTTLRSADRIAYTTLDSATSTIINNPAAPLFAPAQIAVVTDATGSYVNGPAGAVTDADKPVKLTATNTRTAQTFNATAANDGSFRFLVIGAHGDTFTLTALDSHAEPLSADLAVSGAIEDANDLDTLTVDPVSVTGGTGATGTVTLLRAAGVATNITLSSSHANVIVPASVSIAAGQTSAQFAITTTATAGTATITATYRTAKLATLTVAAVSSTLASLAFDDDAVEGGTSVNATVTLTAAAPAGGAIVALTSADSTRATVPANVTVPEGETVASFTITTQPVGASTVIAISASYGVTHSADLTLTPCAMAYASPATTTPATTWFNDAAPTNATVTGTPVFDTTQAAAGSMSLHFTTATGARDWSFTNASALTVGPDDELVLYALINRCNPPRQIAATWSGITNSANWGENLISLTSFTSIGSIPNGNGAWVRLAVPARTLGVTTTTNVTGFTLRVHGGEAWFDLAGKSACTIARAAQPQSHPSEVVWFDETAPAGATLSASNTSPTTAWTWSSAQSASGATSQYVKALPGQHESMLTGATAKMTLAPGDVLYTYVLVDPCNPPREILLQFYDGTSWDHRAYWGEDLVRSGATSTRMRLGAVPAGGGWVRLEVPAHTIDLDRRSVEGMTFTLYDGAAWFDVVGRIPRTNVAAGKTAKQSSNYDANTGPERAVDGNTDGVFANKSISHTLSEAQPWWEVDLGETRSIDTIQLWNRTDCCGDRLANLLVFVSDTEIGAKTTAQALATPGVRAFRHPAGSGATVDFRIQQSGRFVRVQLEGTGFLNLAEVQVWAPIEATHTNAAAGIVKVQQSSVTSGGTADRAVNGNVNGEFNSEGSVTHTNSNANAWWEIDLGSVQPISSIDIVNRLDCCTERLTNFYVFVSDDQLADKLLATALAHNGVARWFRGSAQLSAHHFEINRSGRYVRVQLNGTNFLSMTEVQIWSRDKSLLSVAKVVSRE